MRNLRLWLTLTALLAASCEGSGTAPAPAALVRSGTSFGLCVGYCYREVAIHDLEASYVLRQWVPNSLEIRGTSRITAREWRTLRRAIDMDALMALPDVIGCPDCADGGAEWIEVERDGARKRVTFEFGGAIASIQALVEAARELRAEVLPEVR
jgi:hypothetical protein